MALGDIETLDCDHGLKEIACPACQGGDPDCFVCEGEGIAFELVAPEHEIAEIFENIRRQLPENKH